MHALGHGKVALALCLFGLSQSGCDIVQGFRDASTAVFPDEKTYFDAPGYRLLRGGYRGLEFASGSSLYLLARPVDREDKSLYVMRYADPRPCVLKDVKDHTGGAGVFEEATTIAFTEEGTLPGTLRFADGDCNTLAIKVPNSSLPILETTQGFLVRQGKGLSMVNPVSGEIRTVIENGFYATSFSYFYVLYSNDGGRIGVFKTDWKEVAWFGKGVVRVGAAGSSFFYEDDLGIHRMVATGPESASDTVIAAGGCLLGFPGSINASESWVSYRVPCDGGKVTLVAESVMRTSQLDFPADPRFMAFLPAPPGTNGDPAVDPFFIFYLTDFDQDTGLGQFTIRTPDRQTKVIGQRADFGLLSVIPSPTETHGYMLLDVNRDIGRFVRWDADGSTLGIAQDVVRQAGDLVTDFDGKTGQFALLTDQGLSVVSKRVPSSGFRMSDSKNRWTAVVDDFEDSMGTLSIAEGSLDFAQFAQTPTPPPKLEVIARGVRWDSRTQFVPALPGIAFFTHYDKENDVGRLEYRNLELRFTATVSDGVAAYLPTPGGLIYSVPFGESAGIWVVRSR